jgi:hypothetical protein
MFTGYINASEAAELGLDISGDAGVLDRVLAQPAA